MRSISKLTEKIARLTRTGQSEGLSGIALRLRWARRKRDEEKKYQGWIEANKITPERREELLHEAHSLPLSPKISILLPVYDVAENWLRRCIDSVLRQIYVNWELCIADDHSAAPHVRRVLDEYVARDGRIKVVFRSQNGHISEASNTALEMATGEFVALLDHDDELAEDALFWIASTVSEHPDTRMIYSDEDLIDEKNVRYSPKFKPDWSRDLFYSLNLITHLSVYKTAVLREIGGFRKGFEGSQDYDLALRVIEQIDDSQIRHIPRVLYHWRVIKGSVAYSLDEKPYAHERARDAIREHFGRMGKSATVCPAIIDLHRVRYDLPVRPPKAHVIVTGSKEVSHRRFMERSGYTNVEITSSDAGLLNTIALGSDATVLCFLEGAFEPISDAWLAELVGFVLQDEIGAVGAKLLEADGTVLSGGLVIDRSGRVADGHRGIPRDATGNLLRAQVIGNFSAVSGSCLVTKRDVFEELGGFDQEHFPNLFDADYCLKLRRLGFRIVFTPYVEFKRRGEIAGRVTVDESERFAEKWSGVFPQDPFCNPNLKADGSFEIDI